jgi:hypothetical protein
MSKQTSKKEMAARARELALQEKHNNVRKRLLGVALVLEGVPFGKAVQGAQTTYHGLRRWVKQVELEGVDSLLYLRTSGTGEKEPRIGGKGAGVGVRYKEPARAQAIARRGNGVRGSRVH